MKIIILTLAVLVAAAVAEITPEQRELFDTIKESCIEETGVDRDILLKFKNERVYVPDEKLNCFGACCLKSVGIMKASGAINDKVFETTLKRHLPPKIIEEVKECLSTVGKDSCETGGLYLDCMKDKTAMSLL